MCSRFESGNSSVQNVLKANPDVVQISMVLGLQAVNQLFAKYKMPPLPINLDLFDFIVGSNLSLTAKRFLEYVVALGVKVVKFDVFGVLLVSPINMYDLPRFKFMN